ncbi:hypothetical protein KC669_02275 [Candidatus Dojkabacteria bacterium]|uniref:N(6)-L-threonylcarbamoyladenine synthase n=1 Tax=Candidatus Dojkabacteria bacterium TaxID=2099670 RepID=A0A955L9Y1_9BACT|nr:hypothetical protein [Candidatus Dojkabacteria bacterium]
MQKQPTTLAIDTSCDETSASVVEGVRVLSNIQPSQMEYHKKYGGVVPSLAKLAHTERIDNVVTEALKQAQKTIDDVDYISVTYGPGLAIALEVGINKAKELAKEFNKPIMIINHMEGHLLSSFAERNSMLEVNGHGRSVQCVEVANKCPSIGVLISGGHTEFVLVKQIGEYEKIGETLDDSCGECLDKCGRMLGLGYPAGPIISEFSKKQRKKVKIEKVKDNQSTLLRLSSGTESYELPIPMANSNDLNMSYSGLKTAFKQLVDKIAEDKKVKKVKDGKLEANIETFDLEKEEIMNLCVLLEATAYEQIAIKLKNALRKYSVKEVWLGGGVVASSRLRSVVRSTVKSFDESIEVRYPYSKKLTTDNAAMIGVAANINMLQLQKLQISLSPENKATLGEHGIFIDSSDFSEIDRDPSLELPVYV